MADKILSQFVVFPPFFDYIHAFGFKVDDRGEGIHSFLGQKGIYAKEGISDSKSFGELNQCVPANVR